MQNFPLDPINPIPQVNIHVLVGLLENKEGQICISQRPPGKHLAGYWEFPGGKKEPGESSLAALIREFQEEIGVNILKAVPCQSKVKMSGPGQS